MIKVWSISNFPSFVHREADSPTEGKPKTPGRSFTLIFIDNFLIISKYGAPALMKSRDGFMSFIYVQFYVYVIYLEFIPDTRSDTC